MANDLTVQVARLVDSFVSQLTAAAKQLAMEVISGSLGKGTGDARASKRARGEKRPRAQLVELKEKLRGFIAANPGLRVEAINEALGTTTRDVTRPLKLLVIDGVVQTKGERRATEYYPKGRQPKVKVAAKTPKATAKAKSAKVKAAKPKATPKAKKPKAAPEPKVTPVKLTKEALEGALADHPVTRDAARALNVDESTVRRAIKRFGITVAQPEAAPTAAN